MFRLAHISDLHLSRLPPTTWAQLANKRLLSYLSWHLRRRREHLGAILDALVQDLHAIAPHHVVVTGDLVNLALPEEFVEAAAWLRRLGPPEWITVVPGNHDALVQVPPTDGWDRLRAYAKSDSEAQNGRDFPFLRHRGPLAIVGLSSAYPSPPGWATGRLGTDQVARLARLLEGLNGDGRCRVVLMHHSPIEGVSGPRRRLIDAAQLRRCIAEHDADLVLHGHEHTFRCDRIAGGSGPLPVLGVPSASRRTASAAHVAQYCVYSIEGNPAKWRIAAERRVFVAASQTFAPSDRRILVRENGGLALHLEPVVAACRRSA